MFLLAFISSFLIMRVTSHFRRSTLLLLVFFAAFFANVLVTPLIGFSYIDRFFSQQSIEQNQKNFDSRISQFATSIQLGFNSPFGIGLGNFYDYVKHNSNSSFLNPYDRDIQVGAEEYVHNIFGSIIAESGYFSLIIFLILLVVFIWSDIAKIKKGDIWEKGFVIAFWSLFSYGLFNPTVPASYQVMFWTLRGFIL